MKNIMRYKGYLARIDFEEENGVFAGNVLGLSEPITFFGASVEELRGDFRFAIDSYVAACVTAGIAPEKQVGGKVLVRLSPEMHAAALIAAKSAGISLNDWLCDAVAQKLA